MLQRVRTVGVQQWSASEAQRGQAAWEAIALASVMLVVVVAAVLGLWMGSRNAIRDTFRHSLINLASTAGSLVDPALHESIRRPEQQNGSDYLRAVAPLRRMARAVPDVHYIYTVVRDGNDVRFVLDAADPAIKSDSGLSDQAAVGALYNYHTRAMSEALGTDGAAPREAADTEPSSDEWGTFMSAYAPIRAPDGRAIAALGIDVDASTYLDHLNAARRRALYDLIPAVCLVGIFGVVFFRVRRRGLGDAYAALTSVDIARQAAEDLAHEQRRLAAVIEGTDVGTWEWRRDRPTIAVNDRWAAIIGYASADLTSLSVERLKALVHPEDRLGLHQALKAGLRDARTVFVCEFRVRHAQGHWVWVLARGKAMKIEERYTELCIAGIMMDISARKLMEAELLSAARKDKLTGLANRAVFTEELERARRRVQRREQHRLTVLFLDFDRFKLVNDTLGHDAGDELLRQIAQRFRRIVRDQSSGIGGLGNLVSRFGGDEFLILLNDMTSADDAVMVARRLLRVLTPPYEVGGVELHSLASIGIVSTERSDMTTEEIIRNADVAMYEAKRAGRACYVLFDETMHSKVSRHVAIDSALRRAIGTPELYLEYQPIVDLQSGARMYVEALIRWKHPSLGQISPSEFIPIAEESGLIVEVGPWVMEEACRALARWRKLDSAVAPRMVSVNLSRAEIALGDRLLEQVRRVLERTQLPPECLQLEVTEREVMQNPDAARALLSALRRMGIRLAVDDFGTGTSSLSTLRLYPFDMVKIDRSFLRDLVGTREVMSVIQATIALVENLGMTCLAEGVENAVQVSVLQSMGCHLAQGFFFSPPVSERQLLDKMVVLDSHAMTA